MNGFKIKRAVNFDLKEELLREHFPLSSHKYAYHLIGKFFEKNNFEHRQYSGYLSNEPLTDNQIVSLMNELFHTYPWIEQCADKVDITNVGTVYDYLELRKLKSQDEQERYVYEKSAEDKKYEAAIEEALEKLSYESAEPDLEL